MGFLIFLIVIVVIFMSKGYAYCPNYKAIVVFDADNKKNIKRCVYGKDIFIIPFIEDYTFLSLKPINIDLNFRRLKTKDSLDISFFSNVIFAISPKENLLQNAANKLLWLDEQEIIQLVTDIVKRQIYSAISNFSSEEIFKGEKILSDLIIKNADKELNPLGLFILNFEHECKIIQNNIKETENNIPQDNKNELKEPLAQENLNEPEENVLDIQKEEEKEEINNNEDVVIEAEEDEDEINIEDIVE